MRRIPNQEALNVILIEEEDPFKRKALFDYIRPYLLFEPIFPTRIAQPDTPGIVTPRKQDAGKLIVSPHAVKAR